MLSVFLKIFILLYLLLPIQSKIQQQTNCRFYNGQVGCAFATIEEIQNYLNTVQGTFNSLAIRGTAIPIFNSTIIPESAASEIQSFVLDVTNTTTFTVDAFKYFDILEEFDCIQNHIDIIPVGTFENLPRLSVLKFPACDIKTINNGVFWNLNQVTELKFRMLQNNVIPAETFKNLSSLKLITFDQSSVSQFDANAFVDLPNLNTFIGSNSQLKTISSGTFAYFPELFYVDLSQNQISTIEHGAFEGSPIEYLNLGTNRFKAIDPEILSGMTKLTELNLRENKLSDLNVTGLSDVLSTIALIDLNANHWSCTCLPHIFEDFESSKLIPDWGDLDYENQNYNGVPCK